MIPKKIHYCWFGHNPLPELAQKCIASWKKYCPDYEIIEWNEDNFDIHCCPYVEEAYEAKKWAFASDYVRLYVVYTYGGIYLDTDVELVKSLDCFLYNKCYLGIEFDSGYIATGLGFGAEKGNEAVALMLKAYEGLSFKENDSSIICPILNTKPFYDYGFILGKDELLDIGIAKIFPSEYFCPINCSTGETTITDSTVSIHHYSGSWLDDETKYAKKLTYKLLKYFPEDISRRSAKFISCVKYRGFINAIKETLKWIAKKKEEGNR